MRVRMLALLVAGCVAQSSAQAQPPASGPAALATAPAEPPPGRRWALIFETGGVSGGPGGDIEDAMHAAHLDYDAWNVDYPVSHDEMPLLAEAQCRVSTTWFVGVLYGRSLAGDTAGSGTGFAFLRINYSLTSLATMLTRASPPFQVGLGPALHRARSRPGSPGLEMTPWSEHWKVGFIAQARAMEPARSRLFLHLTVKYSFVGSVAVGPYPIGGLGPPTTLPPTSVQYNHWLIGGGLGLRL